MRQFALSFVLIFAAGWAAAFEIENRAQFGASGSGQVLRIISTADIGFFEPMIISFLAENPDTEIDYVVASSTEMMRAIHDEGHAFDLAISSAMDLQTKLANDGKAQRYTSAATQSLPDWAIWNDMLFAFTQEPAAIVVSKHAFGDLPLPRDRHELINLLRQHPDRFRGRVGTYDVRQSGLGYLFATQDTRASETYWRLTEVFGALEAKLYCCSSDMIEAVKTGELLIAYNVLGSYAMNREDRSDFAIILPSDFTTVMLRTAMIPYNAPSPVLSGAFVDHLLRRSHGPEAQPLSHPDLDLSRVEAALNRIRIGPGLLVFLDQLKKRAFLSEWESAILQN
ncbi:ABC transporter substrate-binding protein [Aliiroseovarius subalbicans]|uniref:ABC transporter substrate-binding protein n=1 Tax=Aliiroseovarius subalbicans TaxID=2925840 RepID=UPI001F5A0D6F|nr:ABC transporter substrate-binding protein [Aliiroseovarius subalbicans]MCI2398101.1 ABC transporter substrate-binding protein [Aliiroseovarius subalbicans]